MQHMPTDRERELQEEINRLKDQIKDLDREVERIKEKPSMSFGYVSAWDGQG